MMNAPAPAAPAAPAAAPAAPAAPAPAAAAPAPAANDQGWWRAPEHGFDADTVKFLDGKNYPDVKVALSSLRSADEMARARNVVTKPDPKNPQGWEGFTELGWTPDKAQYKFDAPKLAD